MYEDLQEPTAKRSPYSTRYQLPCCIRQRVKVDLGKVRIVYDTVTILKRCTSNQSTRMSDSPHAIDSTEEARLHTNQAVRQRLQTKAHTQPDCFAKWLSTSQQPNIACGRYIPNMKYNPEGPG